MRAHISSHGGTCGTLTGRFWPLGGLSGEHWFPKKNLPQEGLSPETLGAVGAIHRQAKQRCPGACGWLEPGVYRPLLWGLKD